MSIFNRFKYIKKIIIILTQIILLYWWRSTFNFVFYCATRLNKELQHRALLNIFSGKTRINVKTHNSLRHNCVTS